VPISEIIIGKRLRQKVRRIPELAASIANARSLIQLQSTSK
jgi:hypothetical protein